MIRWLGGLRGRRRGGKLLRFFWVISFAMLVLGYALILLSGFMERDAPLDRCN